MCDCPEDETGGRSDQAIGTVPKSNPRSLLLSLPPGRRDQDEAGVKTRLEYAKEEASRSESAEVRGRASSRKCGTYMVVRLWRYRVTEIDVPQRTKLMVRYFPTGYRCMRRLVGYWATRYPM